MKKFSEYFRGALREDRQLNAIISYRTDETFNVLTTQDDKNLLTENEDFLVTEKGYLEYDKESINSVNPLFNTSLFKTTCKSAQIDCTIKIPKGTIVRVQIGTLIEETQKYEYLDFGNYIVGETTYQANTGSYLITAYDKMVESMVKYDDSPLSITYPIKHKDLVIEICKKFNWNYDLIDYPNFNKNIVQDFYKEQNLTYRDILDDLNGVCGGSFMFDINNKLIWKRPTETNEIVEDNDLKDNNVNFSEKFGTVNALTITTNKNVVLDSKEDSESILQNGKTEFNIDDNYILNYSTEDFIDEIFNEVNGLEYYLHDIDSTGLLIFEPLDIFTFRHNGVDYKTIMFNDDIKLTQGLVETVYAEQPEEVEKDYKTTDKNTNKLNNAIISLDKANAEIQLKVNKDALISEINLSPEVIKLKGNRVIIDSTYFSVYEDGEIIATSGKIGGFELTKNYFHAHIKDKYVYTQDDLTRMNEIKDGSQPTSEELEKYDINEDGIIDQNDILIVLRKINGYEDTEGEFYLYSDDPRYFIKTTGNGTQTKHTKIGLSMFETHSITATNGKFDNLDQTSLAEKKKNFEKFENALQELDKIDIYKYHLKNENDDDKKHLGFVIGKDFKYSELVTSQDNQGVDNYSFTSLCFQMIKEQQEQINKLRQEINKIKGVDNNG